ncbi:MAG TPA: hypothetical protein PLC15_12660 [Candidatus Obscuribacter sp.]|nr:hypothetical protein [Candidatus Obscuribacter sp.]HMY02800.1 hypothetical protein [Candidatus Obscuribacter sp.]HMY52159.1 hypothetical protein [Candidatus Obscuribacter sp.]HNB16229.1 hypothetical protein [Candidatus Obscuribacter sp.]HND05668.1 hypothetical protein [Candidatus Obscuribacter sp.]
MLKESQIKNLWLGVTVLVMIGVYPPWKEFGALEAPLGFASIFSPPVLSEEAKARGINRIDIDFSRLSVELFLGIAATVALVLSARGAAVSAAPSIEGEKRQNAPAAGSPKPVASEPLPPPNTVTVELQSNESIGEILVESEEDADYWEPLCKARGTFYLPRGKKLQLELAKDRRVDLALLKRFPTGYLHSIDGEGSKITDDDAEKIASVTGLKELDLSGTPLSSKGVEHLRSLKSLEKLWLDNTLIDDTCVPALISLSTLKKLSLEGTSLNEIARESLKKDLPESTELKI